MYYDSNLEKLPQQIEMKIKFNYVKNKEFFNTTTIISSIKEKLFDYNNITNYKLTQIKQLKVC